MSENKQESFSPEVYRKTSILTFTGLSIREMRKLFYIGKGKGNRVFNHAHGVVDPTPGEVEDDSLSQKITRIRQIKLANLEVGHVIHRHGLSEDVAFEVEAALIDAYPGISNIMNGHGNNEFGSMHSSEIIKRYHAEIAEFKHKALLISVNKSALESSVYEATRFAWRLSKSKAESADVVLATVQGLIVGAFVAEKWLEATAGNFPGLETIEGRFGFYGVNAPLEIQKMYLGKRIPDEFRKKGASNPIKYTW